MKEKELFAAIYGIAELNREGFTFSINDNEMQATGYAVARKETQNSFGAEGLQNCIAFALANNVQCIGGWYDNESEKFYFDATEIFSNKDAAIEAGKRNDQIAIFDLDNLNEIRL